MYLSRNLKPEVLSCVTFLCQLCLYSVYIGARCICLLVSAHGKISVENLLTSQRKNRCLVISSDFLFHYLTTAVQI